MRPFLVLICLVTIGCGGGDGTAAGPTDPPPPPPPPSPTTGALRFITATGGRNLDPDGYTVVLDDTLRFDIGRQDTFTVSELSPGLHSAILTGLHENCYPTSSQPISKSVVVDRVDDLRFGIECLGVPDDIYVTFVRVRFEDEEADSSQIAGLSPGGTVPVTLTSHPSYHRDPAWSPDGRRLAFGRGGVIHVVNADGTGLRSFDRGENPDWSPDGSRIAYDNGHNILVFDPDGAEGGALIGPGTQPDWSPDGTRIAAEVPVTQSESDIYVMNADGSGRSNVTQRVTLVDREPDWSPDGSQIVFRRLDRTESVGYDLWVMDADGSNQTRLLTRPGAQTTPKWSPDNRILFGHDRQVMVLDLGAGGSVTPLTSLEPGIAQFEATWRPTLQP